MKNYSKRGLALIIGIIMLCVIAMAVSIFGIVSIFQNNSDDNTSNSVSQEENEEDDSIYEYEIEDTTETTTEATTETTTENDYETTNTTSSYNSSSGTYCYDLDPDEWYVSNVYSPLKVMNCAIQSAQPLVGNDSVVVLYYPVCSSCHYANTSSLQKMSTVSPNRPETFNYYCNYCGAYTLVRLQIIY